MLSLVFLVSFTLALLIANVYCFRKKLYLYLFIPCMLFLPSYYGVEFHSMLPLLTVTRMMYIVFFIYALKNKKRSVKSIKIKELPKEYLFLAGYFVLRLLSNLNYLLYYGQAIKTFYLIIFEQLFLVAAVYILAPTKDEIYKVIKVTVWVSAILFIIGVVESIFGVSPFMSLYTVQRDMYVWSYYRLGLQRAATTFSAPALYGNMCILVMPLILYLYEKERTKKYLLIAGLDVIAVIHSGARSDMIFLVMILACYFCFVLEGKGRRILFAKNCGSIMAILLIYVFIASGVNENLRYFYIGTGKSILNEVGFDFDLNEGAPADTKGYGENKNGSASRIRQFTSLEFVLKEKPLFGYGAGAIARREVKYYWHHSDGRDDWITAESYDVGLVELVCEEGLMGFLGMCSLIVFLIIKSGKKKYLGMTIFCYLLSTLSTCNMYSFLMFFTVLIMVDDDRFRTRKDLVK